MLRFISVLFLLVSCGQEYEPLVEWSGNVTERSDKFILSYDKELFPESQLHKIEQWWIEVQTCTGVSVEIHNPITIEYLPLISLPNADVGRIEYKENYIAAWDFDLTMIKNGEVTKHEFIHYLIHRLGLDNNHAHVFFTLCDELNFI